MVRSTLRERKIRRSRVSKIHSNIKHLEIVIQLLDRIAQSSNQQKSKFIYIDPLRLNLVTIGRKYLTTVPKG